VCILSRSSRYEYKSTSKYHHTTGRVDANAGRVLQYLVVENNTGIATSTRFNIILSLSLLAREVVVPIRIRKHNMGYAFPSGIKVAISLLLGIFLQHAFSGSYTCHKRRVLRCRIRTIVEVSFLAYFCCCVLPLYSLNLLHGIIGKRKKEK
jgi:hypothetical protein